MKDIEIAKNLLIKEDYTLVVVKDGNVLFTSTERGIKPMYELVKNMKAEVKGASIADKVIGRGAALLSSYLNIGEVYGIIMSKEAIEVFKKEDINHSWETTCDYVQNRDKSGLCPIEKLSLGIDDPIIFIEKLKEFLKS